jgi:hypothetical protein
MAIVVVTGAERVVYRLPSWAPGSGLAAFAPNGKRILFGFWCIYGDSCPASSRGERNATLATIHPGGRGLRLLRLKSGADSGAWSPDGKRIVFRCRFGAGPLSFRLCISKLNGTGFRRFPWPVRSAEPDWPCTREADPRANRDGSTVRALSPVACIATRAAPARRASPYMEPKAK